MGLSRTFSAGPDATDVAVTMSALQSLHGVSVKIEISPIGDFGEGGVSIVAIASRPDARPGEVGRSVSRRHHYPCNGSKTFEGALYKLLFELDRDCGAFWQQQELPGA